MKRLAFLAILFALPLIAQDQPKFGEKVNVNVVLLDAVVTDSSGHQILGLDKDDFIVKEKGVTQQVESVDYYTNRKLLNAPEEKAPFKVEQVHEDRYFIFFFDKPDDTQLWSEVTLARKAAENFVDKQMKDTDRVAIVGHDVRLEVYSDFTNDKRQLAHALDEAGKFSRGVTSGDGPILSTVDKDKMITKSGTVYEGLTVLADSLRGIKGRKNLILFSPGILEQGQAVTREGVVLNESRYFHPMIDALNAANVTVYSINLQRETGETPAIHQTLDRLAAETNGEYYRHPVNFEPVVKRIEETTNGYYLLTYTSHHPRGTSGFQKVDVSVKSPGLHVRAREGYSYGE